MTTVFEPTTPTCPMAACEAAPAPVLCSGHARQLGDRLASLGARYDALSAAPSMQGREPNSGGRSGLASTRSVGLLHVMALRDPRTTTDDGERVGSAYAVLAGWAAIVRDEFKIPRKWQRTTTRLGGTPPGPVCDTWCAHETCRAWTFRAHTRDRLTLATERRLLAEKLSWILEQDWAGDFATEIDELWTLLLPASTSASRGARPVTCPECGGPARWASGVLACPGCGHSAEGLAVIRRGAA